MPAETAVTVDTRSPVGHRRILIGAVLGSGVAFLDAATVNIALPSIQEHLGGGLAGIQWVTNAYLLTVSALLLYGGSLGDQWGWGRAFRTGLLIYSAGSLLCAFSPGIAVLVTARAVQGVGAALLLPSSLPLATASLEGETRDRTIGSWTALVGVGAVIGPFVGGWLIDVLSWRAIFLLNLPLTVAAYLLVKTQANGSRTGQGRPSGMAAGLLAMLTLGGVSYLLIEGAGVGWSRADVLAAAGIAVAAAVGLVMVQRRAVAPLAPGNLMRSAQFVTVNLLTLVLYGGVNLTLFVTPLFLQKERHLSPFESAAVIVPVELTLALLSPLAIRVAIRIGPWLALVIGPLACGGGCAVLAGFGSRGGIPTILTGIILFSVGFAIGVAPLNAVLLRSIPEQERGAGFGVNNAVARVGGLLAIALFPVVERLIRPTLTGGDVTQLFSGATWFAAGLCLCSVVFGVIGFRQWKARG